MYMYVKTNILVISFFLLTSCLTSSLVLFTVLIFIITVTRHNFIIFLKLDLCNIEIVVLRNAILGFLIAKVLPKSFKYKFLLAHVQGCETISVRDNGRFPCPKGDKYIISNTCIMHTIQRCNRLKIPNMYKNINLNYIYSYPLISTLYMYTRGPKVECHENWPWQPCCSFNRKPKCVFFVKDPPHITPVKFD